jgi:hypothetical protein
MRVQTYSPDGKVYQLEYAQKAIDKAGSLSHITSLVCAPGLSSLLMRE